MGNCCTRHALQNVGLAPVVVAVRLNITAAAAAVEDDHQGLPLFTCPSWCTENHQGRGDAFDDAEALVVHSVPLSDPDAPFLVAVERHDQDGLGTPFVYVDSEGVFTPEQVRAFAVALVRAAELVEADVTGVR